MVRDNHREAEDMHEKEKILSDAFWENFAGMIPKKHPPVSIWEEEETGFITIQLPGLRDRKEVLMKLHGQNLIIEGLLPDFTNKNPSMLLEEIVTGKFKRTILLPFSFDHTRITASYKQGLLHIAFPKKKRTIDVPFQML